MKEEISEFLHSASIAKQLMYHFLGGHVSD